MRGSERRNLAVQLKDTKSVVGRLKVVLLIVLHIVSVFFYLVVYEVSPLPRQLCMNTQSYRPLFRLLRRVSSSIMLVCTLTF